MLKLHDFNHLPLLEPFFDQIVAEGPGVIILAGMEMRPPASLSGPIAGAVPGDAFLTGGSSALFDILLYAILAAAPQGQGIFVAQENRMARVPRQFRDRAKFLRVEGLQSYARRIDYAAHLKPSLLVVDRLTPDSAPAAFSAARAGIKVLSTFDSALCGAALARQLLSLGVALDQLEVLTWLVSVQRLASLCPACREPQPPDPAALRRIAHRFPRLAESLSAPAPFWRARGCDRCRSTGRSGDVTALDLFHPLPQDPPELLFDLESVLPLEEYIFHLALQGALDLEDLAWFETDRLRRAYNLLSTSGLALEEASSSLQRKIYELEASKRVLVQRTEAVMSLEGLGQTLIETLDLRDLAGRVCRRAGELCAADHIILYLLRSRPDGEQAEVLASHGWEGFELTPVLAAAQVIEAASRPNFTQFTTHPPGVRPHSGDRETPPPAIQAGLRVPLLAQDRLVGVMIIQSSKKSRFTPGETALLQTFSNQAALAIQRAGLVEDLRAKIIELEAAQAELAKKERMQRELELAREVQQKLLPREFPRLPGFLIAALSQPARQVGGDFYDVIRLDADHFGVVIADVSDKGMPAALYMGLSRSLILAEAHRTLSPRRTLENVNRLLLELGDLNGFVSVFYGVVQISTRILRYTRAGHEKPWLLRGSAPQQPAIQLAGSGMVLGVMEVEQQNLTEEELVLAAGDRLVMFTDGVTDVTGPDGRFFGAERLARLLRGLASAPAAHICAAVTAALAEFSAGADPFDDLTLMIVEVE